ncbi:MAG TPA: bifunctional diaminohydroxyphosphoribosylaminopyrimidine deaminase/5-amino-6-(5-phosphoribosylamino)uracil reductase RibD [Planctomycetota bacterium]|nr:bifunctional diaminohydroxyphosphoribosylaminopyrimidine deaminase/5-amino-6-(5-phosphoribosylamino)uracil reductase RibD [Planctomycetota bacterium]
MKTAAVSHEQDALDARFMARAIELAARGTWRVSPNPRVGAVIARQAESLAEGWHKEHGGPHAEAEALRDARARGLDVRGATLYVTLEPCGAFEGKLTPPCVEAVLGSGVARIVVAQRDPNPNVDGRSLDRLEKAGIEVRIGVLEDEARALNGPFNKWNSERVPYVTAKWAMSLDGKIASRLGRSKWISGEASRRRAHALRGEVDAVLVGVNTVIQDDPLLTRRDAEGRDPARVVVDSALRLSLESQLVKTARESAVLVVTTDHASEEGVKALRERGVGVVMVGAEASRVDPVALLDALGRRGYQHVLVEGGGELLGSFFAHDLVDRVVCFVAPKILGGDRAPGPARGEGVADVAEALKLVRLRAEPCGEDLVLEGLVHVW